MAGLPAFQVINLILAAASLAASFLLRPKTPKAAKDDQPPNLATRGSKLNHIIGTRRCGALLGWVGNRFTGNKSSGGGKGGGGGASQTVYFESGWHLICVGPADGLTAIISNGKTLWNGNLLRQTTPSGSTVTTDQGSFRIYWGESTQPIDPLLADVLDISSRWPYACFVVWVARELGFQAVWPQTEYVVTCLPSSTAPGFSPLTSSNESFSNQGADGINPAHALWRMLVAPFPHGCGISEESISRSSFETLGVVCESEGLASNIFIEDELNTSVGEILIDLSAMLFEKSDQLHVRAIRFSADAPAVLSEDNFSKPDIEMVLDVDASSAAKVVYTIKNEDLLKYKDWDLKIDDDSDNGQKTTRAEISISTNPVTANIIANRRAQERSVISGIKLVGIKQSRNLYPGDSFSLPDYGVFRVMSRSLEWETHAVKLDCILDNFSFPQTYDAQISVVSPQPLLGAAIDIEVSFLSFDNNGAYDNGAGLTNVKILRLRGHTQIKDATVHVSADGVGYTVTGTQTHSAGGYLQAAIGAGGPATITNILLSSANLDILDTLDLSADTANWSGGRQWAVIGEEIFYLDAVTLVTESLWAPTTAYIPGDYIAPVTATGIRYRCVVAGTSGASEPSFSPDTGEFTEDSSVTWEGEFFDYTMNNLIRSSNNSPQTAHSIGDPVFIIDSSLLDEQRDTLIADSNTLYVKSQPLTDFDVVDLSLITPVSKVL